nr:MAG TPA: hypothetical protein [Caudoviricetes sp.]
MKAVDLLYLHVFSPLILLMSIDNINGNQWLSIPINGYMYKN